MNYWLIKSEPNAFSIDDLMNCPKQTEHWDGIRNYQVRNMIRDDIKVGDQAFFYHSNAKPPGIVGIVEVVRESYPDHTAFDPDDHHFDPKSDPNNPRWLMFDVKLIRKFSRLISLEELRAAKALSAMKVTQRGNRLSITPVTAAQWKAILKLE